MRIPCHKLWIFLVHPIKTVFPAKCSLIYLPVLIMEAHKITTLYVITFYQNAFVHLLVPRGFSHCSLKKQYDVTTKQMNGQTDWLTKRNLVLTCTNTENTPYTSPHTGYNGQCPAVVLPTHPQPQRQSFAANSDNTDSYYRISHASPDTWRQRQNGISVLANVRSVMCIAFNKPNSIWSSHLEIHSFCGGVNVTVSTIQGVPKLRSLFPYLCAVY
jgi:hypothetical protein